MSNFNKGIEYRPNIFYDLGNVPPNKYVEQIIKKENYVTSQDTVQSADETSLKIDFLILKTESKLAEFDGFNDYKAATVKKYYCQQGTTPVEDKLMINFENKLESLPSIEESVNSPVGVDADSLIDCYKRLLVTKREIENDLEAIMEFYKLESYSMLKNLESLLYSFNDYLEEDYLNILKDIEGEENVREHLDVFNRIFIELENKKRDLITDYNVAVKEKNTTRAQALQDEIQKIEKEIDKVKNSLGYTASQSHALYQKIESTDNFIKKLGYMIIATPFDHLGDTVCCFLKLILKQIDLEDDISKINDSINNFTMSIKNVKNAIDGIRGIMAISYNEEVKTLINIENQLLNWIMSPVKSLVGKFVLLLRNFESSLIGDVDKLFDKLAGDSISPDNVLDCIYLDGVADFVYDEIESMFDKLESYLVDLYKFVYSQIDLFDENSLSIYKKLKKKKIYDLLTKLSASFNTLDKISLTNGIESWVESFLIENGYGTTYNNSTGKFENISLGDCIDKGDYNGYSHDFLPESSDELPSIELENNEEYQQWLKSGKPVTYQCEYRSSKEVIEKVSEAERKNRKIIDKLAKDINKVGEDSVKDALKYIKDKGLQY